MAFNPLQNFLGGQQAGQRQQANNLAGSLAGQAQNPEFRMGQSQDFRQLMAIDPDRANKTMSTFQSLGEDRKKAYFDDMVTGKAMLMSGDLSGFGKFQENRLQNLKRLESEDTAGTEMIIDKFNQGDIQGLIKGYDSGINAGIQLGYIKSNTPKVSAKTAGQREFESLTGGLTGEQIKQARLIELGLSPRAVGSAVQTITDKGIAEQIGKTKATIKQREKFGELTANSRAKTIDAGIEKISKIDLGLNNINRAVALLNDGAGVGAIQKFLPSFRASSVALDNVQKSMALDVIGAVTFGALSEGELNLAKEVALPTGLDSQQLIKHLQDRKSAQEKLRGYFNDQIQFLDQGGTVAGFLRARERESERESDVEKAATGQTFNFDAQGNLIQ
jgi:hypothetical protein